MRVQAVILLAVAVIAVRSEENANKQIKTDSVVVSRRDRALKNIPVADFIDCAIKFDAACVLDKSEEYLQQTTKSFWNEVDGQARSKGASEEETPSALVESISKIITELTDIFKNGLDGLFRDAKENEGGVKAEVEEDEDETDDDDDEDDEETDQKEGEQKSRKFVEEARGKKKKKKKALMKLLILGLILKAKLGLLLKIFAAKLQVKFLLIAAAGLLINAIRLYFDLKKGHSPQKVIYYEHAQHQHHYDHADEDWSSPGGHWGRSYVTDNQDNKSAQDLAYASQKPSGLTYTKVNNKPNYSWK